MTTQKILVRDETQGDAAGLVHDGVPPEVFFALSFDDRFPQGKVTFHDAFKATGPPAHARGPD